MSMSQKQIQQMWARKIAAKEKYDKSVIGIILNTIGAIVLFPFKVLGKLIELAD